MATDRVALLRNAEMLVQQGKLDQAITEYRRIINDQPRDWNTANVLGDLYLRAGQIDRAVDVFVRVADSLSQDGVLAKAAALYKKILKVRPHDEHVLLRAADMAAGQGLLAEARAHLKVVNEERRRRGDTSDFIDDDAFISKVTAARRLAVDTPVEIALRASDSDAARLVAPSDPVAVAPVAPTMPAASVPATLVEPPTVSPDFRMPADETDQSVRRAVDPVLPSQVDEPQAPRDLDDVFADLRKDASRRFVTDNPRDELAAGLALYEAGQLDFAIPRLEVAARAPATRFRAASILGRLYVQRGDTWSAIDWFERAAEVTAPTPDAGHRVLYELADALERVGEVARALAVCLELRADAGDYEDVEARVDRLAKAQARG